MGFYKMLKVNTRRALSGGWGRAIGILFILLLPALLLSLLEFGVRAAAGLPEFVDYAATPGNAMDDHASLAAASMLLFWLVSLLEFLVGAPLVQGAVRWHYRRTGGEDDSVSEVFSYFESAKGFFRALGLRFQMGLRMLLWTVLLSLPALAAAVFWMLYQRPGMEPPPREAALLGLLLAAVWGLLALAALLFLRLRYFLAPYLLAEHPDWKARRCIKQGVRLMKGQKTEVFGFYLSFFLWWVPAAVAAALLLFTPFMSAFYAYTMFGWVVVLAGVQALVCIYLLPYLSGGQAMYARYLIQRGQSGTEPPETDSATREYDRQAVDGQVQAGTAEEQEKA